jgi:hypothetical protein
LGEVAHRYSTASSAARASTGKAQISSTLRVGYWFSIARLSAGV